MPPKNKGKKGKKADDDDYWAQAGESIADNNVAAAAGDDSDDDSKPVKKSGGGFAALMMDGGGADEEEEDYGGLMSAIKASSKGKKDKKDKKKEKKAAAPIDADDEPSDDAEAPSSKKPVEVTADDLADEEWGPVKEKGKKGKKGKGKKARNEEPEEEEQEQVATPPKPVDAPAKETPPPAAQDDDDEEAGEEPGAVKILSKKEKEKLKKEREKAKKKAQAAAKKAAEDDKPSTPATAPPESTETPSKPDDDDDDKDEAATGKADSKKKKKKKAKKDEEPAPAPAPTATKKKGGISALKAMMEEKKRLEEEARRAEEEERKRIEEEERKAAEEEKRKEEEKQRRKDKEKAKRELAKKEGRLLTKKQKEERAAAEMRKQALLASGVQIEGLQQGGSASKKPVYGNRKKKGPGAKESSPAPESRPRTPATEPATPVVQEKSLEPEPAVNEGVKDEWDASSEEDAPKVTQEDVKDSWDASSDEEEESKPAPVKPKATEPNGKAKAAPSTKASPAPAKQAPAKTAVKQPPAKGAPPPESESDEDDSSDEDDEDDEDDDDDDSSDEDSGDEELSKTQQMAAQRKAEAAERRAKAHEAALAARSKDDLRSPICCILGHVDTGKTKLLDKIRQTNVQEGEAGGITQQIGATYFPQEAIRMKTAVLNKDNKQEYKVPGLLIIDTPGHESFTNLRSRGSSLCNIAILVVDIMHGLEAQTLESLRLLRDRKTPFIVALNKIDRMYGWQATPDGAFRESLAKQSRSVQREFEDRVKKTILAFAEEGLNAVLYYENKSFARNVSLVPTSAITGEGVPDMIMLLINLTQQRMSDRLMYLSELECTVLEVKVIEGLGTTIDVVLSNGTMKEGDKIVVCGLNGPIVTQVRALLTPQPLRELRIKSAYVHHKEVKAALGVKIVAPDLEKAIAGSRLLVCGPDDDEDDLRDEVMSDLTSLLNSIDKSGRGVCVQASTLGSLEALLDFLKVSKIPVSGINIGPVHKKDIMRAGTMLEKAKELACILCFDVPVDKDADRLAEEMGIRIFKGKLFLLDPGADPHSCALIADIIYHLFDQFKAYNEEITEAKRRDAAPQAVWPCRLKIIAAFCKRDPIILGVDILDGTLRVGTPLSVVKIDPATQKKEIIDLGKVTSLEINHKAHEIVKKSQAGAGVAVKIEHAVYQSAKMFGRHFDDKDEILSHITRQSIDVLKASFRTDVSNEEWALIKALKPRFGIQ
ncbi:eukaryotic translation initiation factor 5B [Marasmius tenuissimus]|uniref:Eukaryotic translation initiation factor 5B n=1 Tax=Marasmius tenuissimus TaxID=585030 RepID=A0ABR2ZYZ0_9AGAR